MAPQRHGRIPAKVTGSGPALGHVWSFRSRQACRVGTLTAARSGREGGGRRDPDPPDGRFRIGPVTGGGGVAACKG